MKCTSELFLRPGNRFANRQRIQAQLRTSDIERAQKAVDRQFSLVNKGVLLGEASGMSDPFTRLNAIKPEMVAKATLDARQSAQQFAQDSGLGVGAIKNAAQGYFSIETGDGSAGSWGQADSPFKKKRVVTRVLTTVDFSLDRGLMQASSHLTGGLTKTGHNGGFCACYPMRLV